MKTFALLENDYKSQQHYPFKKIQNLTFLCKKNTLATHKHMCRRRYVKKTASRTMSER